MTPSEAALLAQGGLDEFVQDPVLTVACVLLVAVSVGWILTARAISKNIRRAAAEARRRRSAPRKRASTGSSRRNPPPR